MTIKSDGNVGINQTSPSAKLDIVESASYTPPLELNAPHAIVKMVGGNGTGYMGMGNGYFGSQPSGMFFRSDNLPICWGAAGSSATHMTLLANGKFGIGTTNPTRTLQVAGAAHATSHLVGSLETALGIAGSFPDANDSELGPGYLVMTRDDTAAAKQLQFWKNGSLHSGLMTDTNGLNFVGSDGAADVTIKTDGKVGIGTTAPSRPLSVHMSSAGSVANFLHYTDASNFQGLYIDVSQATDIVTLNNSGSHGGSAIDLQVSSASIMYLQGSGGKVGIGTTAPGKRLHVYSGASGVGASSDVNMILEGASNVGLAMLAPNNQGSRIEFGSVADNNEGIIYYNNTGSYFSIYTNGTRQVDITSAGNVGIGQADPRNPLEVDLNQSNGTLTGDSAAHFGGQHHTSGQIMGITLGYREANDNYRKVGIVAAGLGDGAARQDFHILVNTANSAASCSLADKKLSIYGTTGIIRVHNKFGIGGDPGAHHLYAAGSAFITGSVGIGTATPAEKLDVNGNIMTTGASTNTGYDRYLKLYGNTQPASNPHRWAGMAVYNNGGNNVNALAFFTGTGDSARTEKVRIHNDGKVGIGSTTPIRQLDVLGAVAGQYSAALINTSATGHGLYIKAAPNNASYMALAVDDKDGAAILVARGDKRVGIGTNAPTKMLEVEGSEAEIRVHDTYANTNATLISIGSDLHNTNTKDSWITFLGCNATNDRSWAIGNRASGFFNFTYIGTRATLPSTGGGNVPMVLDGINNRVGIGLTVPTGKLNVGYTTDVAPIVYAQGSEGLVINATRHDGSNYRGYVDFLAGRGSDATNGGASMRFFTQPRSSAAPIQALTLQYDGNVGIGTTDPGQKLHVNGNILVNAQILTPGGSNLQLNPNTGLVTVGGALTTTGNITGGGTAIFTGDMTIADDLYLNATDAWIIAGSAGNALTGGTLRIQNFGELEVDGVLDINGTGTSTFAGALTTAGRITLSNAGSNNGLFIGGGWQIFDNASENYAPTGGLSFYHGGARLVIGGRRQSWHRDYCASHYINSSTKCF